MNICKLDEEFGERRIGAWCRDFVLCRDLLPRSQAEAH
jgi:hypothetical protein